MRNAGFAVRLTAFIAAMLALGGCAPKKVPIEMDSRFAEVSTITLLPIVDARRDRSHGVDLDADVLVPVQEAMRKKGYTISAGQFAADGSISADEVAEMTPAEIAKLGPPDAHTLMVVSLNDVYSRYVVMAYTFKAEVEGLIVDKESGRILWKDKGVVSGGQGGLVSGVLAAVGNPARGAAVALTESLPDRMHH